MNHTSSDHPWFQASRNDPTGPYGDWYVWGDDDTRWSEARVIFVDTEPSNWTWDATRGQYYWHRFFSHQPDLNYDNPEVQTQMLDVLRFWLDLGLDGFRLDAVPYLYERDGTNGENLPETHAFLKRVRTEIDSRYADRVLLAEANQWPDDVVEYFGNGDGDECHMAFHFPVMPRMFMAVRREDALPIVEVLENTPSIPGNAQWGLFLRNHDELTLEMVTDEERDYMYDEYAKDPRMKLNLGIRRRLAPLLDNGRDEIQLLHAMLFSLPGSPVLYYGDEIGMGDNIFLGDRDGVRTPMQWTGDRNAGFSRCRLRPALPAAVDGPGLRLPGRQRRGAAPAAQLAAPLDPSADRAAQGSPRLRNRHLRGAAVRQSADLRPRPAVRGRHDHLRAQPGEVGPGGPARPLALAGHDSRGDARTNPLPADRGVAVPAHVCAARVLLVPVEEGRVMTSEENALIEFVTGQRWFGSKTRDVVQASVVDRATVGGGDPALEVLLVEIRFDTGTHETYQLLRRRGPRRAGRARHRGGARAADPAGHDRLGARG